MIKVAAAVYTETKTVSSTPYNLYITKTVSILGGFTCADFTNQNPTANITTINPSTPTQSVVSIIGQFGNTSQVAPTLDGFTISGGGGGNHGGGISVRNSDATISNNIISGNTGYLLGGGIWAQNGAPLIQNNRIENNLIPDSSGDYGGGVELEGTQATLSGNTIANNSITDSTGYGGGVAIIGGGPVILTNNTIQSNSAATTTSAQPQFDISYGGGVYVSGAPVNLTGNTVTNNQANAVSASGAGGAYGYGGGIYITNSPSFTLSSNTISNNTAGYKYYVYLSGGGLQIDTSSGTLTDNVIQSNSANGNILFGNGGGVAVYTSTVTIQGGQISNNKTAINYEGYGGGLYAENSSVKIDSTRFDNNAAANSPSYGLGGGLDFFNSPYTITNAIISNNYAYNNDTSVGGLSARGNSPGVLINNTFANNKGQGIRIGAALTATNNVIQGLGVAGTTGISLTAAVPVSVTYNDFYNFPNVVAGFSLDPSNIVINPNLDSTFHLNAGSPAIDAGTHTNAPNHDIDGESRAMIGVSGLYKIDIGADEFAGAAQRMLDIDQGQADLTIIGPGGIVGHPDPNANNWMGYSVMGADVNGDGHADLIMSAQDWAEDFNTLNATGRLFGLNHFGARTLGTIDLYSSAADLIVVSKYQYQHVGQAFASGDINGDGKSDLIVSSNNDDNTAIPWPTVFTLFGGASLNGTRTIDDATPADFMLLAPAKDYGAYGNHNALAAGDVSGDGIDDLLVGDSLANDGATAATGAVFGVFGSPSLSGSFDLSTTTPDLAVYGPAANAKLEKFALGQMDNNGQLDIVARTDTTAYVLFGPRSGTIHLSSTPADVTITGLAAGGVTILDFNGDGTNDLILGSGSSIYVVPGPFTSGQSFNVTTRATLTLTGITANAFAVGQVVGDTSPDLIIGAGFDAVPQAIVVPGGTTITGSVAADDLAPLVTRSSSNAVRYLGADVAAGDLDGDGNADLIVGTLFTNTDTHPLDFEKGGKVFVIYGTGQLAPGAFDKSAPLNGAGSQPTNPTLNWTGSSGASSYEYCYDTTNDNTCSSWTDNGTSTSKALSGLTPGTTYYWQVRANNAGGTTYANANTWWSFTTLSDTPTFGDVPTTYWAYSFIERLYSAGITGGCSLSPLMYCPEVDVNRAQMAVFLLRGEHGSTYVPPDVGTGTGFTDVPTAYWAAAWIKQLAAEDITSGCGPSLYCPETSVTRDQMAVFLLRAEHGASYTPPPATGVFTDVPTTHWAAAWIEQLAAEGITGGCGVDTYCPSTPVTRAQMAVFLVRAFNLP